METDGEAANPGPLAEFVLTNANCTSLRTQFEEVVALPGTIKTISETRLPEAAQKQYGAMLADKHHQVIWGAPCRRKRFGSRVSPGGVAVLAVKGLNMQKVAPRNAAEREAYDSGRFLHVAVSLGAETLHVIVIYGYTNSVRDRFQRDLNEKLLGIALECSASLGQVPVAICGDLNTTIEASNMLCTAIRGGGFKDLAALGAEQQGLDNPQNTCFQNAKCKGSRIDHVLANKILAPCFHGYGMIKCGLPTHVPQQVTFNLEQVRQDGVRYRQPKELPLGWQLKDREQEDMAAAEALHPMLASSALLWEACIAGGGCRDCLRALVR